MNNRIGFCRNCFNGDLHNRGNKLQDFLLEFFLETYQLGLKQELILHQEAIGKVRRGREREGGGDREKDVRNLNK